MYFYKMLAGDYEDSYSTVYWSHTKYTQKEFEDIVFSIFSEYCKELIEKQPLSLCYPNINFTFDEVFWDYKGEFNAKMAERGFYQLDKKLTGYMFFDLTLDSFFTKIYKDVDDSYDKRADEIINQLNIDESCWDNNCPILENDEEEKQYARQECMVHCRKAKRIKKRTCDNCMYSKEYCRDNEDGCKYWHWDGQNE